MSRKMDWVRGLELCNGFAALGPERVRPVQDVRDAALFLQRGEGDLE
jgi:hypothetical protein